jgi:tetratricopeptide (TPR) repeat protein
MEQPLTPRPQPVRWVLTTILALPALGIATLGILYATAPIAFVEALEILETGGSWLSMAGLYVVLPLAALVLVAWPPALAGLRLYLGGLFGKLNLDRKAERDLLLRLEQFENSPDLVNLGQLYGDAGLHDQAIPPLVKAAEIDPNEARIHFLLARSLHALGQLGPARQAAEHAISLDPQVGYGRAVLLAGELALRDDDLDRAAGLARMYQDEHGDDSAGLMLTARTADARGETELRDSALTRLLELGPGNGKRFSPEESLARHTARRMLGRPPR